MLSIIDITNLQRPSANAADPDAELQLRCAAPSEHRAGQWRHGLWRLQPEELRLRCHRQPDPLRERDAESVLSEWRTQACGDAHRGTAPGNQKYWYDQNGNATRRISGSQDITLSYDAENRLTAMSGGVTSSYVYDGDGKRVKETISGATRAFVGSYYEVDNGVVKKYYYAGSVRVAESSGGVLYYLLTDHLGSTALTLNSSGARQTELRYYPFGAARYNANNQVTTYRFTGQRWDSGTALYFYQSRWYDPIIGRFLAADTVIPQPENPQNLNRYSYVGNQPLGFIDPSGHAAICGTSVDDGCGGIDALHSIELQLRRGRLDPIGAKQAYYQYYLAHPGEDAGAYQPLHPTEEFNGIISTGYAQAQAELGAGNLGGLALEAATTNGVIFE
ncbi:RHS repeat-associated core domain-containing protein, partial [Candidatus Amarobacter glycogenicus]|uniref:RHS repeat domain-containing protein n=1 Tax=Candidatus Amarobacter glycogenicus TaxID=3140699 RepID=UPI003135DD70|nr:RHS repeat-associated core domain-containing protein [Dehalococcoidia bacterium]